MSCRGQVSWCPEVHHRANQGRVGADLQEVGQDQLQMQSKPQLQKSFRHLGYILRSRFYFHPNCDRPFNLELLYLKGLRFNSAVIGKNNLTSFAQTLMWLFKIHPQRCFLMLCYVRLSFTFGSLVKSNFQNTYIMSFSIPGKKRYKSALLGEM